MRKKISVLLAVVAVLSMVLSACGPTPTPETIIQTVEVQVPVVVTETVLQTQEVQVEVVTATPVPEGEKTGNLPLVDCPW